MQIIKSICSRSINFKAKHFSMFLDGRRLRKLKNIHSGKRCFIIGNGPSLNANDLDILHTNNEITFAFNRIYYIFNKTDWRPNYYISQDEKMLAGCVDEVSNLEAGIKFIPAEMDWYMDVHILNKQPFHIVGDKIDGIPSFSQDISKYIVNAETVVYSAFQIAYYMGIREMYLLGVDQQFHKSINNKGEIIIDSTVKDYFTDEYNFDKEKLYMPNTDQSGFTFLAAKKHSEELGFKIMNATRGGKLELFERVNFDDLF